MNRCRSCLHAFRAALAVLAAWPLAACVAASPDMLGAVATLEDGRALLGPPTLVIQLQDDNYVAEWAYRERVIIPPRLVRQRVPVVRGNAVYYQWQSYWLPEQVEEYHCTVTAVADENQRVFNMRRQGNACSALLQRGLPGGPF